MALTTVNTRSYVLACETPLLRGKTLCPFLKEMDQEEFPLLDHDHKEELIRNGLWKSASIRNGLMYGGTGVVCIIGGYLLMNMGDKKARQNFDEGASESIGGMVIMGIGVTLLVGAIGFSFLSKDKLYRELDSDIVDERICRLKNKIRIIDEAFLSSPSGIDNDQLLKVRDYFDLKLNKMLLEKTNVINVKVN